MVLRRLSRLGPCCLTLWLAGLAVPALAATVPPENRQVPPPDGTDAAARGQIPGNRTVSGVVEEVRSDHIKADIGTPQPLFLPLSPAKEKGFTVKEGDRLQITLNDHNAVVDYHPVEHLEQAHRIIEGKLASALTVGHDVALVETGRGEERLRIASRARSKLSTIPVGAPVVFLLDETGEIVDAQLTSQEAVEQSEQGNKPPIKGAHRQIEGRFIERPRDDQIKIRLHDGREEIYPVHLPMGKLDQLAPEDLVILLTDNGDAVIEIATPSVPPR